MNYVPPDRGLTPKQIYVMYFCSDDRDHEKAWSAVETQLAQVRAVHDTIIPLYAPDGEPWIPSEDGYYEAGEIGLTPAVRRRREREWTAAEQQLERAVRKLVRLSLPHTSAMAVSDVIVAHLKQKWVDELAEQFHKTVREQLGLHDIWQDYERLFGFFPEYHAMGHLAYHTLFAAFMDRIDVSEKIVEIMRYVAIAPGYLPKDDPTTWIAYSKTD